jgi:hypothetical protein
MPDMTEEQEQAQQHPPAWSTVFGDDNLSAYTPQDQAPPPGPKSSAARHSARVREGERQALEARRLAKLQAEARERLEDDSLEVAQGMLRAGRPVPADTPGPCHRGAGQARGDSPDEFHPRRADPGTAEPRGPGRGPASRPATEGVNHAAPRTPPPGGQAGPRPG